MLDTYAYFQATTTTKRTCLIRNNSRSSSSSQTEMRSSIICMSTLIMMVAVRHRASETLQRDSNPSRRPLETSPLLPQYFNPFKATPLPTYYTAVHRISPVLHKSRAIAPLKHWRLLRYTDRGPKIYLSDKTQKMVYTHTHTRTLQHKPAQLT